MSVAEGVEGAQGLPPTGQTNGGRREGILLEKLGYTDHDV